MDLKFSISRRSYLTFRHNVFSRYGAEVIHIESPSRPDLIRIMPPYANGQATAHSYLNRNKQSIVLDLKDAASIDLIKAKISEFDIVIEQFPRCHAPFRAGLCHPCRN